MPLRAARPVLLLLPALLLSGCAGARDAASTVSDCAALASDIAQSGLAAGVPRQAEVEQAVQRLDERVSSLDSEQVRDAATDLRDRLRELQEAARSADPAAARQAAERARQAARRTAEACRLPAERFLGG